jgi:hypothetical protein
MKLSGSGPSVVFETATEPAEPVPAELWAAASGDLDRRPLNSSVYQALFMSENPVQSQSAGGQ